MEQLEETRSTYKGELRRSPVTDKYEPYYPPWETFIISFICNNSNDVLLILY